MSSYAVLCVSTNEPTCEAECQNHWDSEIQEELSNVSEYVNNVEDTEEYWSSELDHVLLPGRYELRRTEDELLYAFISAENVRAWAGEIRDEILRKVEDSRPLIEKLKMELKNGKCAEMTAYSLGKIFMDKCGVQIRSEEDPTESVHSWALRYACSEDLYVTQIFMYHN